MEESRELRKLYGFIQSAVYASIILEIILFTPLLTPPPIVDLLLDPLKRLPMYQNILYSKSLTLFLVVVSAIGTRSRKDPSLRFLGNILLPVSLGIVALAVSVIVFWDVSSSSMQNDQSLMLYCALSFVGTILLHAGLNNISKKVGYPLLQDRFNKENESFRQSEKRIDNQFAVNIPMRYYFKKWRKGWINITHPFRGTLVIGTPGSGKTASIIRPFIKQAFQKKFTACLYDFKYPDLAKDALQNARYPVHVVNLNDVEQSCRVNPLKAEYIKTLAQATETAEALVEALRKSDRAQGADQFFHQSAINLLSSVVYFLSCYENGRYSSLPHVLAMLDLEYPDLFSTLFSQEELHSLLSPFRSAYERKAFDQLEGQIGTLKINLSRLGTKELYWVFSGDDVNLRISHPELGCVIILAGSPDTQNINSASYSVVLNRITKLINCRGNLPCTLILDELPTIYVHKIENLIATARSNRVAVLMGLQEIPQFRQQYGRQAADTISSVTANIFSGAVRHPDTLSWLEKMFGKIRQLRSGVSIDRNRTSVSRNEYMDYIIPAGKIASLKPGEIVGKVASDVDLSTFHCQVKLEKKQRRTVQQLPKYYDFAGEIDKRLLQNMKRIKREIKEITNNVSSHEHRTINKDRHNQLA